MKRALQLITTFATAFSPLAAKEELSSTVEAEKTEAVEVCFVLDTTGSMSGLIQGAKEKIWTIANEITTHHKGSIRMGLIAYRDRGDDYITEQTSLTDDLDAIHTALSGFQAQGGGDGPESVNQALNEAITQFEWNSKANVKKLIFLVGDAPPHMDYDEVQYPELCKTAGSKGLLINSILCGNNPQAATIWSEIAQQADGKYAVIPQSGGTVTIATPFDEKINRLSANLNETVICWGSHEQQKAVTCKLSAITDASRENQASRAQYATENFAGKVITGNGDLIDDWKVGKVKLSELKKSDLPEEQSKLDKEELEKLLNEKLAERERLQTELAEQVAKRSQFLQEQKNEKSTTKDSFDAQVSKIISEQLAD